MSNYIPNHLKKQRRLTQEEHKFARLLGDEPDARTLAEAVEEIRAAQIRVLKARREVLSPCEKDAGTVAALNAQIDHWHALPQQAVIEHFRKRCSRK